MSHVTSNSSVLMRTYVVIPVYNGRSYLPALLNSLFQEIPPERVILVDNASNDGGLHTVASSYPQLMTIPLDTNEGFGFACNTGIRHALKQGADWVVVLNQDLTLEPGAISNAVMIGQQRETIGFLAFYQLNYQGTAIDPIFRRYLPADYWDDLLLRSPQPVYEVPFVPAAAILLRRDCLLELGAFDPLYFMYLEDRDLCHRLQSNGWRVAIATLARVRHDCGQVRASQGFRWSLNWYRSRMIYHLKTSPRPLPVAWLTGLKYLLPQWSGRELFHWIIAWLRMIPLLGQAARHRKMVPKIDGSSPSSEGGN